MPRILVFAGSTRRESYNRRLAAAAAALCRDEGADATLLELRDYPLPLYSQDLEADEGIPPNATELKRIFQAHDGLVIACPEYNGSITPLLKNTLDWLSRRAAGETSMIAYNGKTAALLSASPGALGGLRGLVHVRAILSGIGVLVLPGQVALSKANQVLGDDGPLADEFWSKRLRAALVDLIRTTAKLNA